MTKLLSLREKIIEIFNKRLRYECSDDELADHILALLQEERKKWVEEIEKLRSTEKDCDCKTEPCGFEDRVRGWNACIDRFKQHLKQ